MWIEPVWSPDLSEPSARTMARCLPFGQLSSVPANLFLAAGSKLYVRMQIEDEELALRAESVAVPAEDGQRALRELSYRGGNALPAGN